MREEATDVPVPARLRVEANRNGLVLMAGAGVSAGPPSSLPGWQSLHEKILHALGVRVGSYAARSDSVDELVALVARRRSTNLFPPDLQAQILEENVGADYFRALSLVDAETTNTGHRWIAWLARHGHVRAVVTTNFDTLIERALQDNGVPHEVAFDPPTYARCLAALRTRTTAAPLQVIKVHGSVQDHRSLVDTLKQRLLGRNADLEACIALLLRQFYWVYAGFSAADLETDPDYLGLLSEAGASPGLLYVRHPGSAELSPGARMLVAAHAPRADVVVADLQALLGAVADALGLSHPPPPRVAPAADTQRRVEVALQDWAAGLSPAAAVNCLATVLEANGLPAEAFEVLERFRKDATSEERTGPDGDRFRTHHGRLGLGGGLLSVVDDLRSNAGWESMQNLMRRSAGRDARAAAWTGLAWVWAGIFDKAAASFAQAGELLDDERSPEEHVDSWLAVAEGLFVMGSPEPVFAEWPVMVAHALDAGDLPRAARVAAVAALYHAEFLPDAYPSFARDHLERLRQRVARLHDPSVQCFLLLAAGRHLVRQREGGAAQEVLAEAVHRTREAGRPPWTIYAHIEHAKACLDAGQPDLAADVLDGVNEVVDRYQVFVVFHAEAVGQYHSVVGQVERARRAFRQAIEHAETMHLTRRAGVLRRYLDLLAG